MDRLKESIVYFSLIALCFDAYAFFYIATFPVTLSLLCVSAILIVGLIDVILNQRELNAKQLLISLLLILFIAINCLFSANQDFSSALLYVFYLTAFIFSGYRTSKGKFYKKLKTIMIFYTILSAYGIYQFFAYIFNLPLQEFILEGFMVVGFNRTNLVTIGGHVFQRAHSIYLEPSTLSQFGAFSILLAIILYRKKMMSLWGCISTVIINLTAALLSVAGTGFLMLGILVVYFCIVYILERGWNKNVAIGIAVMIFGLLGLIFLDTPIVEYIRVRIIEIIDPRFSGGMRFSYPYLIMFDTWAHKLFGYTPGNEFLAISDYFAKLGIPSTFSTMASGYAKIGVELGIIGLVLLIVLLFTVKRGDAGCRYIFIFMLCINIVGGNLLQNYFWVFVMLLNVNFVSDRVHDGDNLVKWTKGKKRTKTKAIAD